MKWNLCWPLYSHLPHYQGKSSDSDLDKWFSTAMIRPCTGTCKASYRNLNIFNTFEMKIQFKTFMFLYFGEKRITLEQKLNNLLDWDSNLKICCRPGGKYLSRRCLHPEAGFVNKNKGTRCPGILKFNFWFTLKYEYSDCFHTAWGS